MTKSELLAKSGMTVGKLAEVLDITPGAISQWPDDQPIPEMRIWQIRCLLPQCFADEPPAAPPQRQVAA